MPFSVLIVDDSLPMRGVLKKTFRAAGYGHSDFFDAASGKDALDTLRTRPIDLVVTDFNMPEMTGLQLITAMKAENALQHLPVIVVSTEGSREKVQEFMDAGAAAYIKKPFTPEQLRELLIQIMGETSDDERIDDSGEEFDF
ncbi:MAG: response regulator [Desulfovibrionales bacterium]|nr:response regulator [Desulfovibrionales bacterium]